MIDVRGAIYRAGMSLNLERKPFNFSRCARNYVVHPDRRVEDCWHVMGDHRRHGDLRVLDDEGSKRWGYSLPGDEVTHGGYPTLEHALIELVDESASLRLPLLVGSSRQIAAATTIRLQRIRAIRGGYPSDGRQFELEVLTPAREVTDAAWWLDTRRLPVKGLIMRLSR